MQAVPATLITPAAEQSFAHFVISDKDITLLQVVVPTRKYKSYNTKLTSIICFYFFGGNALCAECSR